MTVLVDSWAWVEYFRGTPPGKRARTYIDGDEEMVASTVNVAEVYRWAMRELGEATAEDYLAAMRLRAELVPVDERIAVLGAKARHVHRLGLGDALVFATASARDARVVTGDADFRRFPDTIFIG